MSLALASGFPAHFPGRFGSILMGPRDTRLLSGIRTPSFDTGRAHFIPSKLSAKQLIRILNDLRSRCLRDVQYLAHRCTKKILFPLNELGLGRDMLAGAWAGAKGFHLCGRL